MIYFHEKIISLTLLLIYSMAITFFLDRSQNYLHPQESSCSCKLTLSYFFHTIKVYCGCFQICPQLFDMLISVAAQFLSPDYVTVFNDLWVANEVLSDMSRIPKPQTQGNGKAYPSLSQRTDVDSVCRLYQPWLPSP